MSDGNFSKEVLNIVSPAPSPNQLEDPLQPQRAKTKPVKTKVIQTFEPKKDLNPFYYLSPESRASTLAMFVELVQGTTNEPMTTFVNDWQLMDGKLDFSKLGPTLKAAIAQSLNDVAELSNKYGRRCPTEKEIIDNPRNPIYMDFVKLTAAYVMYNVDGSSRQYHTLRQNVKRILDLRTAYANLHANIAVSSSRRYF